MLIELRRRNITDQTLLGGWHTHNVHEGKKIVLHMLFPMKTDNRIIYSEEHLDVVVIIAGVSPSPGILVDLFSNVVKHPRHIESRLCITNG